MMIAQFNSVSLWVAATIVRQKELKARIKFYEKFIKIADVSGLHRRSTRRSQRLSWRSGRARGGAQPAASAVFHLISTQSHGRAVIMTRLLIFSALCLRLRPLSLPLIGLSTVAPSTVD